MRLGHDRQPKIPTHIVQSLLRPDIFVAEATRLLILLELTVPLEERLEEVQERKRVKCLRNWWRIRCMPEQADCQGFESHFLCKTYSTQGIMRASRRRTNKSNGKAVEKLSRWLIGVTSGLRRKPLDQSWLARPKTLNDSRIGH